jgi:hypothetical protein
VDPTKALPRPLLAGLAWVLAAGCSGATVNLAPDEPVSDADLTLAYRAEANSGAANFSEQMTWRLELADGGSGYVQFLVSNVATMQGRARLRLSFEMADGTRVSASVSKKRGYWDSGDDRFEVTLGDSSVVATGSGSEVVLKTAKVEAELTFSSRFRPIRPRGGSADFGSGKFYQTTLLSPRARVSGTVTLLAPPAQGEDGEAGEEPEERSFDIEGHAIVDHRTGNMAPYLMARRWFNVHRTGPTSSFVMSAFERTEALGGKIQGWLLHVTDDGPAVYLPEITLRPEAAVGDAESGYAVPMQLHVEAPDGTQGVVKAGELERRAYDLANLSGFERMIVERVMKPWSFRYAARYLLRLPATRRAPLPDKLSGGAEYNFQQIK